MLSGQFVVGGGVGKPCAVKEMGVCTVDEVVVKEEEEEEKGEAGAKRGMKTGASMDKLVVDNELEK